MKRGRRTEDGGRAEGGRRIDEWAFFLMQAALPIALVLVIVAVAISLVLDAWR